MYALLRMIDNLPLDVVTYADVTPVSRSVVEELIDTAILMVPVVGNIVAGYEAYSGQDLFGNPLSDLERGVLAATVLLPVAGRLVKGGEAVYTETRLVQLYGRNTADWSRVIAAEGRIEGAALRSIERAEALVRSNQKLTSVVAQEVAAALPEVVRGPVLVRGVFAPVNAIDQAVVDLLRDLSRQNTVIASLDEFALRRVLQKGPNIDHLKGQLLEELTESFIVPWLRNRPGSFALGVPSGAKLEFFPGHLVRDHLGSLTDGILGYRVFNRRTREVEFTIVAVFESKGGTPSARGLSYKSGTMSEEDRLHVRAAIKDEWRDLRDEARSKGLPFNKTIEDVAKDSKYIQAEKGGQISKDVQRLYKNEDGTLARIRLGAETLPVTISPTQTKFFGIVPKDVNPALIERQLKATGHTVEIIGVDIRERELQSMAERMKPVAETMAASP
jgi:hypothetical protein